MSNINKLKKLSIQLSRELRSLSEYPDYINQHSGKKVKELEDEHIKDLENHFKGKKNDYFALVENHKNKNNANYVGDFNGEWVVSDNSPYYIAPYSNIIDYDKDLKSLLKREEYKDLIVNTREDLDLLPE